MGAPCELTSRQALRACPGLLVAGRRPEFTASSGLLGALYARPYDIAPGELHASFAGEKGKQHFDTLTWSHALIEGGVALEGSAHDAHPVAAPQAWRRQHDQAAAFPRAQIRDDLGRKTGRMIAIHNEPHDAGRVAGGMPLQLDAAESVGRKQQARAVGAELPGYGDARTISFITVEREGMQRELDAVRHELSAAPIGHDADRSAKLLEARPVQISRVIRWRP